MCQIKTINDHDDNNNHMKFLIYLKFITLLLEDITVIAISKGVCIKYVGGGNGGFYKFFKNNFVAQETIDQNISWPSNFFRKYFVAPPINFSFLFKVYLQQ